MNDLGRIVPGVRVLRTYQRAWLANDVVAGIVLVGLLTPAGMAYAQAAGLPPVTGLYATVVPLLVYALLGPSRILVMGPDSALAPLVAAVVIPLSDGDPGRAVALAGALSLLVGLIGIAAGVARLGFLADLLSLPVRYGYLNGIALTIVVSQLPTALGVDADGGTPFTELASVVRAVIEDGVTWWAVALSSGALTLILVLRRVAPRVPGTLLAMVGGIVVVVVAGLADQLDVVGQLPRGLPAPAVPDAGWSDLGTLLAAALGIAFVAFADTSVLARVYATKRGERVDSNQELIALGGVNVASAFFQGFPVSGSQSRTPVAEEAGARTQLTGVVAALALLVVISLAPGLFRNLPSAVLAAVVIAAAMHIFAIGAWWRLLQVRRSEFLLATAAFASVALLGPVTGVGVAVGLSLLNVVRRAWMPHTAELVRIDGIKGYHDADRHPEGRRVPGLLLYRFDAPLFFANAQSFSDDVVDAIDGAERPIQTVVITAEPITDIDSTAAEQLGQLLDRLDRRGVRLEFAELKGHVRDRLSAYGLAERIGTDGFSRTVGEAVRRHVQRNGVDWVDWEDRDAAP